jgi:hypothetical protein
MVVAIASIHGKDIFAIGKVGQQAIELQVLYLVSAVVALAPRARRVFGEPREDTFRVMFSAP